MIEVVLYKASWCGPCQQFEPIFNEAARSSKHTFSMVDIDTVDRQNLIEIESIPTVVIYRDGQVGEILRGSDTKVSDILNLL